MIYVAQFFSLIWSMFGSFEIPLLGVTPAQLFLALIVIRLSIKILSVMFGLGAGGFGGMMAGDRYEKRYQKNRKPSGPGPLTLKRRR